MADKELALAIVGTGGIAKQHRKNLEALGGNKIVAVCDVDEENLKEASAALGATAYTNFNEMFDKESGLDAVLLCTPPTVRKDVIAAACDKKLPVFCEKPPARTNEEAAEITDIVERSGNLVSVGFMYRYVPATDRIKELIAGEKLNLVQGTFLCNPALARKIPGWFFLREKSGGHIVDQAIHMIDLIRFIAGDITEVHTLGNNVICPKAEDFTTEDSSSTNLRFASGASGSHVHSWAYSKFVCEVVLTGAEYRLTLKLNDFVNGWIKDKQIDEKLAPPPAGDLRYWEMQVFLNAVRTGDASNIRSPYADAAKTLATVNAMNQSIDDGKPVELG
ncbi:MAG: Gfo/Idh/MocA family oxidoreductase [Planctomycetes bacterium]|nr:Gfo/Idh/MocA family oxidoreductase [Planctomycetota bacterium]